jgi:beta-galactosidase
MPRDGHLSWTVPYEPGTLTARGFRRGETAAALEESRTTAGPAASITLTADRARIAGDGEDVAVVAVSVTDAKGVPVPRADNEITFTVTGAGKLIGVGNGDPSSHESDKGTTRRLFNGRCAAIAQANAEAGELRVEAASPGLVSASLTIAVEQAQRRAWL